MAETAQFARITEEDGVQYYTLRTETLALEAGMANELFLTYQPRRLRRTHPEPAGKCYGSATEDGCRALGARR